LTEFEVLENRSKAKGEYIPSIGLSE
jgi:hypothetical protein